MAHHVARASGGSVVLPHHREAVELVDPQDVTAFYATCPEALGRDELAESVRRAGVGELLPGDRHLVVDLDSVRRLAAGRVGPSWTDDLQKMVAYAAGKGWVDAGGTRVRAHLKRV